MTKGVDYLTFLKDYRGGKSYREIALKQNCSITTVANAVKRLSLKRDKKTREIFSEEERYIFRRMIETHRGREQLLEILRGK